MDAVAESGGIPRVSTRFSLSMENEQADAGQDDRTLSRETNLSGANGGREIFIFPRSADHKQDWQPYLVDLCSAICDDHTYIFNRQAG